MNGMHKNIDRGEWSVAESKVKGWGDWCGKNGMRQEGKGKVKMHPVCLMSSSSTISSDFCHSWWCSR